MLKYAGSLDFAVSSISSCKFRQLSLRRLTTYLVCLASLSSLGAGCLNTNDEAATSPINADAGHLTDAGVEPDAEGWQDTGSTGAGSPDAALSDADGETDGHRPDGPSPTDAGSDLGVDAEPPVDADQPNTSQPDTDQPDTGVIERPGPEEPDAGWSEDAATAPDASSDTGAQPSPQPTPPPTNSAPPAFLNRSDTRAMWLWADANTSKAFLDNRWGMQDDLMQLAAAPHGQAARSLNRIFFEVRTYSRVDIYDRLRAITYEPLLDATEQAKLRAFNKRAHAQGVAVEYLDGQAIWLANDTNAQWPKQVCRDVVTFNLATTDVTERLDGVHYDIEPHTVQSGPWAGQWWQNKLPNGYNADWTQRWKDIMNSCRATFDAYETQTGHHLTLSGDLGADYAFYNKPVLDFFNGPNTPVDYITLMNYYDNRPNQNGQPSFFHGWNDGYAVTGGVIQNLGFWTNVPVLFGMETGPTGIAADYMSFYQEGHVAMYSVVDTLIANHSGPGMLGVAFHPWGSFKDLQP